MRLSVSILLENVRVGAPSTALDHVTLSNVVNKDQVISWSLTLIVQNENLPHFCYLKREFQNISAIKVVKMKIHRTLSTSGATGTLSCC